MNPDNGEMVTTLAQRIANIEKLDKLLEVSNAINRLTLCGVITSDEYWILSSILERTRNYLYTMGQTFN